jgi:hypothetical protein
VKVDAIKATLDDPEQKVPHKDLYMYIHIHTRLRRKKQHSLLQKDLIPLIKHSELNNPVSSSLLSIELCCVLVYATDWRRYREASAALSAEADSEECRGEWERGGGESAGE